MVTDDPTVQAEPGGDVSTAPRGGPPRAARLLTVLAILLLLFGIPWWALIGSAQWPTAVTVIGSTVVVAALVALPVAMTFGHGPRHSDRAAVIGDVLLGTVWVLFVWTLIGLVLRLVLFLVGVEDLVRSRATALVTAGVVAALLVWGYVEAMRVPRVKRLDVVLPRLGRGLDGLRVVAVTDTHFGPLDRRAWSRKLTDAVNELDADIVCHVGDIADGTPTQRVEMAAPLADMRARLARVYVTGNHEYFSEAQAWLERMDELGWDVLHNRHIVVERAGDRLVVAGVDDATARGSGVVGHGADLGRALAGVDDDLPVFLLAHQPKQIGRAVEAGVDLQISGHTHGGQIWPFNFLVRLDQPVVHGLSRHGERTQLYTSRGSGFWGPPFRVFAPSEITVLTLRSPEPSVP